MKKLSSGRTETLVASSEGEQGFWPSYADMMSAVALILFFLMLLSYIQNLITGNDLQSTQEVLEDTRAQLSITMSQVDDARARLDKVTIDLENKSSELDKAALELDTAKLELDKTNLALTQKEKEINAKQELIDRQAKYLTAANDELVEMRSQMQTIAVLRLSILEQIRDSIVKVMGDASKVSIGDNGSIILSEGVLFDLGSSEIKSDSQPILNKLSEVFASFLSDEDNAKYVDSIVISGHTDDIGTDESNRQLSTDRANSVLNYLLLHNNSKLEKYSKYFCAAGYGETRPVEDNKTDKGRAANRRIEISMILKDDSVLKIVEDYLKLELPDANMTSSASAAASKNSKVCVCQ